MAIIGFLKRAASAWIEQHYPDHKQRNAALGIGCTDEQRSQMVAFINAVRARCDEFEQGIENLPETHPELLDLFSDITP